MIKTIQIITPFRMQWEAGYRRAFHDYELTINDHPHNNGSDVMVFMWCNEDAIKYINETEKTGRWVVFIRRYEYYATNFKAVKWDKVEAVILVNPYFAEGFKKYTGITPHVVYNGVVPEKWKFKKRAHGNKIALVGFINQKKNIPLALQILAGLPKEYELHLAGGVQDSATMDYIDNFCKAVKKTVIWNGHVDEMDLWLEDKNYLLSTAISEGCPNNVIEAMAKGIKPIVHNWPGAKEEFSGYTFNVVDEALAMINPESPYESEAYRNKVVENFGFKNYEKVKKIILGEK